MGIKSFFSKISNVGIDKQSLYIKKKEIVLSNKISIVLIPFAVLGLWLSYQRGVYYSTIGFGIIIAFLISVLPLNKSGKSIIARFGLSILLPVFLLLPNIFGGIGQEENYLAFSYIFIAFSIIPLLLFQDRKDFGLLALALVVNLLVIIFYDALLILSENNRVDIQLIENNYVYFKLPQIILWIIIVSAFQYMKNESISFRERLENSNKSLRESNKQIRSQNEEILVQNSSLSEKQVRIEEQAVKLGSSNSELKNTKLELLKTIEKLKEAKDKLLQKEAEAKSIFNALNEHYLVAQYDLNGDLVSINTKVTELLGVLKDEHFEHIKPVINKTNNPQAKALNGQYYDLVWNKIIKGEAQTIDLEYKIGDTTKFLASTFAPLFDMNNKPFKILAIGHDVTELVDKNEKIDKVNDELSEKVNEISEQNILLNFQQSQIFETSEELHKQKEEIQTINDSLEQRVKERTSILEEKNKQLTEYAFINSHVLRSPVSTMMGLINLMSYSELPEDEKKVYVHLKETAKILDKVVFKINNAIENGFHFDRDYLEPERNFLPINKK